MLMANFVNIENLGSFYADDITFVSWPKESYNVSQMAKPWEFDVHVANKKIAITIKGKSGNEEDVRNLLNLHAEVLKLWKKQANVVNLKM